MGMTLLISVMQPDSIVKLTLKVGEENGRKGCSKLQYSRVILKYNWKV